MNCPFYLSCHCIQIRFRTKIRTRPFQNLIIVSLNHSEMHLLLIQRSLSYCITQLCLMIFRLKSDNQTFSYRMFWQRALITTSPEAARHPHTITVLPPCLTAGMISSVLSLHLIKQDYVLQNVPLLTHPKRLTYVLFALQLMEGYHFEKLPYWWNYEC